MQGNRKLEEMKETLAKHKEELKKRYRVREIGIFGSYVRGVQKRSSDLDILVEFEKDAKLSLLDVARLEIELSDLLGVNVDLVEKRDLKPYIGEHVLSEVIYV
jgi:hypothetical protein